MTSYKKPRKIGVVLIQLGSPESVDTSSVRRFLRQFLGDKRVLDIPFIFRFLLLHLIILPRRSKKSAKKYQLIWTPKGSPLVVHSNNLARAIGEKLNKLYPEKFIIKLAIRYGNPSIENIFDFLIQEDVKSIKVLPLFPQYSSATTGSIYEKGLKILAQKINIPPVQFLPSFYDNEKYIGALSYTIDDFLKKKNKQKKDFHFLFTFHSLPIKQIKKADPSGNYCLQDDNCCNTISSQNHYCYRAHCLKTVDLLVKKLKLKSHQWSFSFQSRLGRSLWLTPYTGDILQDLAKRKIRKVVLVSPSFVADGLETLEELGKHEHDNFIKNGGKECILVPCLNSHPLWVDAIIDMIK